MKNGMILSTGKGMNETKQNKMLRDIENALNRIKAFMFWVETLQETDDKELAEIAFGAMEELLPGTMVSLVEGKYGDMDNLIEKCRSFDLL